MCHKTFHNAHLANIFFKRKHVIDGNSKILCMLVAKVVVRAKNSLDNEATSLHLHGMRQEGTGFMDGAGSVTQCNIQPGETFMYRCVLCRRSETF